MMPLYLHSSAKAIGHKDYTALLIFAEKRGDRRAAGEAIAFFNVEITDDKPHTPDILTALYEYVADETAQFV